MYTVTCNSSVFEYLSFDYALKLCGWLNFMGLNATISDQCGNYCD